MDEDEGGGGRSNPSTSRKPPRSHRPPGERSRGGPRAQRHDQQTENDSSQPSRRRTRPGRAERQRRKNEAEINPAPTTGPSHLNPAAPDFIPRNAAVVEEAKEQASSAQSHRGRGRGGRRGRQHQMIDTAVKEKGKGNVAEAASQTSSSTTGPRTNESQANFPVPPKVIKESDDLILRLTDALIKDEYDCSICTDKIHRYKPVWSCPTCWAVFHRSCIKKWASHSLGEGSVWRCPGCQTPRDTVPQEYRCWCGKVENPDVDRLSTPHSCTQPCLRKRKSGCACVLPCHPGPCPPCFQVHRPPEICFCGKESRVVKCVDYDPDSPGWSCGQPCLSPMDCNAAEAALSNGKVKRHSCRALCHAGPCPPCHIKDTVACYCGKHTKEINCSEKEFPMLSQGNDEASHPRLGFYQCEDICGRKFDCGIHSCEKKCHPQDVSPASCPRSAAKVKFCPCGKTPVASLTQRTSCQDPIPLCPQQCEKLLSCGHECRSPCHHGDCPPCELLIDAPCRCGSTTHKTPCHKVCKNEILCERTCTAMKSCGRHHCGATCCSGDHLCTKICGRPLKCGSHNCTVLCHRGPCPTCLEASFEPVICTCGRTELPPPIRCGTKLPQCPFPCLVQPACRHPPVAHACHPLDEECPKCPYLVEKECMCGKRCVKNQPCFRAQAGTVSCGLSCGELMPCGFHRCPVPCHRHMAEKTKCVEKCGKPRKSCGHACQLRCHSPSACDDSSPCQAKVTVRCDCGLQKREMTCLASSTESSRGLKNLPCTDLCARTERNRKLAEALDIDTTASFHEPENMRGGYPVSALDYFAINKSWCLEIEDAFRNFLAGPTVRFAFKPMNGAKREFVHLLAEAWGFDADSIDHEPFRSVEIRRTSRANVPRHTLSEAAKLKNPHLFSAANYASSGLVQLRKFTPGVAYNAIFLEAVKGTVLQADLQMELNPILRPSKLVFGLKWINDDKDVVLSPSTPNVPIEDVEIALHNVIKGVKHYIATSGRANSAELCWVNREGQVSYRESTRQQMKPVEAKDPAAVWNQYLNTPRFESSNAYDVLNASKNAAATSNGIKVKKEKKADSVPVLDSWENFEG